MTKANIVQRLLEEKHITAEEAVVLLQSETPLTNLPQPYTPYTPYTPTTFPIYPGVPYIYSTHTHTPQE